MAYSCTDCDASFGSAGGIVQHVALHHRRCGLCDEGFETLDELRSHVHTAH